MVELLVVVALFAILLALVIPAVLSARSAARRTQCQANLRSIGQALLAFEAKAGRLPAGRDQANFAEHSWATRILPHLEEQALYDRYDWRRPWNDMGDGESWTNPWDRAYINGARPVDGNLAVATTNLAVFVCPETAHDYHGAMDYGGNYGTSITGLAPGFEPGQGWDAGLLVAVNVAYMDNTRRQGVRLNQVTDGMSHTFLVLEDAGREPQEGGMWANGHNCFVQDLAVINHERSNEIYSDHPRSAHALLGDGSVMVLTDKTDYLVLGAMCTRAGRETGIAVP